ncbi:MGMT family protein [Candidatus Woesearchaeota archaeon]|nr:MGMT family protein [Candidatus Woesearchaeota archaeon]
MGFSCKVYDLCRRIPKGKVTTYKIIAGKLGTKAYRAVGNALHRNPCAPQVPCHRVVGSDGRLVGFAHGIKMKKALLQKEGIEIIGYKVAGMEKVLFRFRA